MLRNKYAILGIDLGVQNSHSFLVHLFLLIFPANYLLTWPPSFFMILLACHLECSIHIGFE